MTLQSIASQIAQDYTPPPLGRPSELGNAETLTELLTQLQAGNRRAVACQLAGISEPTFYRWLKEADAGLYPQTLFARAVKKAEAFVESKTVQNILKASELPQFWAAGMTYLERKNPQEWGRRTDDANVPRVVVQIGVQASDVKVAVLELPDRPGVLELPEPHSK